MKFGVVLEKMNKSELGDGYYYAHVPSLGLTTHGLGIEGALSNSNDLVKLWIDEKKANNEEIIHSNEELFTTFEIGEYA
ncbi:MAG: hypothetical protein NT007_16295 [Candidatus Kapabacteria bacterium]|nr:hypothetical protein [Candidatus Kapabacteria bacterium]